MSLPIVRDVVLPSCIAGCANGQLPADVLVDVGGGQLLVRDAAASWQDMARAASRDGVLLIIDNAYRSYDRQVELFTARYVPYDTGSGERVMWNGQPWWKLVGAVTAAVPAQSNHGYGLAVDLMRTDAQVAWLCEHAADFGWSAELESEPWHWRRFAGDYTAEDDMAMSDDDMRRLAAYIAEAIDARPRSVHSYRDGGQYNVDRKTLDEYTFAEQQQAALAAQGLPPK